MGERVNIQYSIDMEELDGELRRLLERSNGCLKYSQEELHALVGNLSESDLLQHSTVEKIGDIRERLAKVDFILSDVNKIIGAYISYQLKKEEVVEEDYPQHQGPPEGPSLPEGPSPEQIEEAATQLQQSIENGNPSFLGELEPEQLQQKLEEFKKSMRNA
jgi:hypothetical protein